MVIHGAKDPLVRTNHAVTIHNRINGSVLKMMAGSGHSPHVTHTEDFHHLVREFIND
jgi:pimeloyl-ACP methyl ester carboxylesterase